MSSDKGNAEPTGEDQVSDGTSRGKVGTRAPAEKLGADNGSFKVPGFFATSRCSRSIGSNPSRLSGSQPQGRDRSAPETRANPNGSSYGDGAGKLKKVSELRETDLRGWMPTGANDGDNRPGLFGSETDSGVESEPDSRSGEGNPMKIDIGNNRPF